MTCKRQQWSKCQITNLSSDQTWGDIIRTTPIQFLNRLYESTYVVTRNIHITTTRLVLILLHFHAVSSRLLLNPWHSNNPEGQSDMILLKLKPHFCPTFCPWWLPTSSTHHIPPTVICAQSEKGEFYPKLSKTSASIDIFWVTRRDCDGGEQTAFRKQRVSLRGTYVLGVNSTMTKNSDYFVWKDTSVCEARRCDFTSWHQAGKLLCIKTPLFLREYSIKQITAKTRKYFLRRAT